MSRPVKIATTNIVRYQKPTVKGNVESACRLCDIAGRGGADIFCLPEAFPVTGNKIVRADFVRKYGRYVLNKISRKAKQYRMYIICASYGLDAGRLYNTAFLIDRTGKTVGSYRKVHPTSGELAQGICSGGEFPVFDTDFGKIGIMICFDIYYPEVPANLKKNGAELLFYTSAFETGAMINPLAWYNRVFVVSSVRHGAPMVVDPQGQVMARKPESDFVPVLFCDLELDTVFMSTDGNLERIDAVKKKYGSEVKIDVRWPEENMFVSSLSKKRTAMDIAREFDLVPLDQYLEDSQRLIGEPPKKAAAYTKRLCRKMK